jgi:hypothetical protein
MLILFFTLRAMELLAPYRDHLDVAQRIAAVVLEERPFFKDDDDKRRTAAVMVAIAFRESSFRRDAVGDNGHSFGLFQINDSSGGTPLLLTDVDAAVRKAFGMVRESMRVCPAHPLAWYASGPKGCEDARAQRISRDRMAIARRLTEQVRP